MAVSIMIQVLEHPSNIATLFLKTKNELSF